MMNKKISTLVLLMSLAACAGKKHPVILPAAKEAPVAPENMYKTNPVYADILKSQYDQFYGEEEEVTKSLEKAFKVDPKSNYLKTHLAYQYAKTEKIDEALKMLEEVLAEQPKDLEALFLYARVLAVKGDFDKSKSVFLQILDLKEIQQDPDQKLQVSFVLATVYIEKGEFTRAKEILESILEENPEHLLSYYYLGRVYSELGRMKEAVETYRKSVEIDARFSLGWRALGIIHEYMDQRNEAIKDYEKVTDLEGTAVDIRTKLIDLYLQNNDTKKAIDQVMVIKRLYPNVPDVSIRLGLFYYQEKMFSKAEDEFLEASQKTKDSTDVYYYLGLSQYQLKKTSQAQKSFSRVKPDAEVYPVSQLALSSLQEEQKNEKGAENTLRAALNQKQTSVDLRVGLANFLIRHSRLDDARKVLEEGIVTSPKEERYLLSLSEIYEKRKSYDELEKTIRKVLAMNPNNSSALNFLGYSYADRNIRLNEAEDMIRKALQIKPNDSFIQDSMGWIYYRKKDYKNAEDMIRKALEKMPDEPVILEHLGDILWDQGKKGESKKTYDKALEFQDDQNAKQILQQKINKLPR